MLNYRFAVALIASLVTASGAAPASAEVVRSQIAHEAADGSIIAGNQSFESWEAFAASDYLRENVRRCGVVAHEYADVERGGSGSDCTYNLTNPSAVYAPSVVKYRIPVVVHVLRHSNGVTGNVTNTVIQSQIAILNEDYLALPGTNGEDGTDVQIEFYLATTDPLGNPTNGITRTNNTNWYNDTTDPTLGAYYNNLAWDPDNYLNIYLNNIGAQGILGYVPALPQQGIVGQNADRVVIYWAAFGRNSPADPYDQGRTTTHEVGHYLGLFHTFDFGCGTLAGCYTSGDRICDTNRESTEHYDCVAVATCAGDIGNDDIENYMNYTDDLCMTHFTPEQARRARCSLEHYRPDLYEIVAAATCSDGIQNQGETLIDCGGPCPPCSCTSAAACNDSLFCTGVESCDAFGECQSAGNPCGAGTWCAEPNDTCPAYGDGDFDDDNDVDLRDFWEFQGCFNQYGLGACAPGKLVGQGVINLADLEAFTNALDASGP